MTKAWMCGVAAGLALTAGLGAQTKTIQGESHTMTATVEGIETASRSVTVKKTDGTYDQLYAPESFKAFDKLKIGDKITAKYYDNVVLNVKKAGEAAVDKSSSAVTKATGGGAGTAAHQRTITATITAIDMNVPSIAFSGPNGWKYSSRVEDKAALGKVKVGDKVDITWTQAMILSLEPGK